MIHWITGDINQGKSTRLLAIYRDLQQGDGFYNRKIYRNDSVVGQEIVHLSTGESRLFSVRDGFAPPGWREECRYDVYSFSVEGLEFGREILAQACRNHVSPLFIDEIGPLELAGQGFRDIFVGLLRKEVEMYVVVRKSCLDRVIAELVEI